MATLTAYISDTMLHDLVNNDLNWYIVFNTTDHDRWYLRHATQCTSKDPRLQCVNGDGTIYAEGEEIDINY